MSGLWSLPSCRLGCTSSVLGHVAKLWRTANSSPAAWPPCVDLQLFPVARHPKGKTQPKRDEPLPALPAPAAYQAGGGPNAAASAGQSLRSKEESKQSSQSASSQKPSEQFNYIVDWPPTLRELRPRELRLSRRSTINPEALLPTLLPMRDTLTSLSTAMSVRALPMLADLPLLNTLHLTLVSEPDTKQQQSLTPVLKTLSGLPLTVPHRRFSLCVHYQCCFRT